MIPDRCREALVNIFLTLNRTVNTFVRQNDLEFAVGYTPQLVLVLLEFRSFDLQRELSFLYILENICVELWGNFDTLITRPVLFH